MCVRSKLSVVLVVLALVFVVPGSALAGSSTVAAGTAVSCSIGSGGSLACWGLQQHGSLGNALTTPSVQHVPQRVTGMQSGVTAVAAGVADGAVPVSHVCAIQSGALKCWGPNDLGQLGTGATSPNSAMPVAVPGLQSGVTDVTVNAGNTCAVQSGKVWCWGKHFGATPVAAPYPGTDAGVASVRLGYDGYGKHFLCTISDAGTLSCANQAGAHDVGQLGLSGTANVVDVATGYLSTCAVTSAGEARCVGAGGQGQLGQGFGTGGFHNKTTPVTPIGLGSGVVRIGGSSQHYCAITTDGSTWCWGNNSQYAATGVPPTTPAYGSEATPVRISGLPAAAVSVTASRNHTCTQLADGTTWCWGGNGNGEQGLPVTSTPPGHPPHGVPQPTKPVPVQLAAPKVVPKPAAKPVVKVTKPVKTTTGGTVLTVTPTTTCTSLTATSTFTKPPTSARSGSGMARARATVPAHGMYIGGFGTSTAKLKGGGSVTLPKVVVPAVIPGQQVTIKVQPVVAAVKSSPKVVDPPVAPIKTTVACTPPKNTAALVPMLGLGGSPAATRNQFSSLMPKFTTGIARPAAPKPATTATTVNPPKSTPSTAAKPVALTPGVWSGKVDGTVSHAGKKVPAGEVSFLVAENGSISGLVLKGAERCIAPAGSRQGGSVTSQPWFTTVTLDRVVRLSPASGFPRKGFAVFSSSQRFGTKSIKLGASAAQPGLTAHGKDSITGTVTALRTQELAGNPSAIVSCSLSASFSAKPGGSPVLEMSNGYTDA